MYLRPLGDHVERDTKSLDALLASLNRSAERFQTLWFSFLTLTLYLVLTAFMTTHRMLLLEEAQSLPIVNLKIGLLQFYWIAPLIYLVLHFYVLVMLLLLARTADSFEQTLLKELPITSEREQFRMRFENALFLQLLVGAKAEREGENSWPLIVIALTTLAIAPVGTLLVIQMQFLPYHHLGITYWHRAAVLIDCALIWLLWRGYRRQGVMCWPRFPKAAWRERRPDWLKRAAPAAAGITITLWASLWEGRWAGEPLVDPTKGWQPRALVSIGWVSDRLRLPNETIVGEALLLEKQKEAQSGGGQRTVPTRSFRDRNFAYADFSSADLRGVSFDHSHMRGIKLEEAQLHNATLKKAQLPAAELDRVRMRGANLDSADLEGASMDGAQLQLAHLSSAIMNGASLTNANLKGAYLSHAQLRGANLRFAQLQAANFAEAKMQGTDLMGAQMQGTSFSWASMQGARLIDGEMQGANLFRADLSGAALDGTQLQGASLNEVNIRGAQLLETFLFRSGTPAEAGRGAWFAEVRVGKVTRSQPEPVPFGDAEIEEWRALAREQDAEKSRGWLDDQFEAMKQPVNESDEAEARLWAEISKQSALSDPDERKRRIDLAIIYGDLACDGGDGAPHVARALLGDKYEGGFLALARLGDQLETVRSRLKAGRRQPAKCPGTRGFTEADWRQLEAIRPSAMVRFDSWAAAGSGGVE